MTDRAFCFSLVLAILMDSDVVISPDDSEGVVLAKVMKTAKEIRSDDKKRVKTGVKTPINRRPGWVPGGSVVCWRLLVFLGAGEARREGRRWGWWCCRWRPVRRGDGLPVVAFWVVCWRLLVVCRGWQ